MIQLANIFIATALIITTLVFKCILAPLEQAPNNEATKSAICDYLNKIPMASVAMLVPHRKNYREDQIQKMDEQLAENLLAGIL